MLSATNQQKDRFFLDQNGLMNWWKGLVLFQWLIKSRKPDPLYRTIVLKNDVQRPARSMIDGHAV